MRTSHRRPTLATPLAVAAILLVVATGCSSDGDDEPEGGTKSSSSASSDGKPEQAAQLVETGIAQAQAGDVPTATTTFENVLVLDPANKFALYNLGLIAQNAGLKGKAIRFYNQALETDPEYTPALYNKAIILESSDLDGAVALYEKILDINPEASTTLLRLSFAYALQGDQDKADETRAKAVELDPSLDKITKLPRS